MRRFIKLSKISFIQLLPLYLALLCLLAAGTAFADDNMLQNGSFEEINASGIVGWTQDMWRFEPGVSTLQSAENGHDSAHCAMIDNMFTNDARFIQTVAVKPNTLYRLSGWVMADGLPVNEGGAGISVLGSYQFFPSVYDTGGKWQQLVCFVRTHDMQKTMTVAVRLGFYSSDTTGCAFFDDVSLVEVDAVQMGYGEIILENTSQTITSSTDAPPNANAIQIFLCVAGAGVLLFIIYFLRKIFSKRSKTPATKNHALALMSTTPHIAHMRPMDWAVLLCITAIYAVVAFVGLGSTLAPQTQWTSNTEEDTVIFDLGENQTFHILYYGGIHWWDRTFSIAFSDDGNTWSDDVYAKMNQGDCFAWQYVTPQIQHTDAKKEWAASPMQYRGRYVKLVADGPGLTLLEVAFKDMNGNPITSAAVQATSIGNDATRGNNIDSAYPITNLIDEQHTVPTEPSYYNSTYFDEIYHVRTAYEHANALDTYEWTHPPLGKLLIMIGIKLFGMVPFGWRFMGTLAGVLMVPAMYMLGKLLFRRTRYAMLASFVMAFDMMHLTQTRLATIDSYAVLFIILMYICMFRYLQMSFFRDGYRTLLPLSLCGLFMGLGCASKWICMYAGIGLAVLFAWSMVQRYLEWRAGLASDDEIVIARALTYTRYILVTLSCCILVFIIIPAAIYYLSYIPHFASKGGLTWERFLAVQREMFTYHASLKEGHPYMSAWYDWPLLLKPMWYYSGAYVREGIVSTIMSMGNPAVWWVGVAAFCYVFYCWLRPHFAGEQVTDHRPAMILLAFAAQFVPWMLVSRAIFIYHYFGSLPFVMLCIVYAFEKLYTRHPRIAAWMQFGYMQIVFLLFAGFYPFATGVPIWRAWADTMNWLSVLKWQHLNYGFWLRY